MLILGKLIPSRNCYNFTPPRSLLSLPHSSKPPPISHWALLLCLLQGSPGSLVAPPWTSTPFSVQGATLPWVTLLQRAKLATWLEDRTRSQRPTWDNSPTKAWDESKPPPRESWRERRAKVDGLQRWSLKGAQVIEDRNADRLSFHCSAASGQTVDLLFLEMKEMWDCGIKAPYLRGSFGSGWKLPRV